jgi:hypothetical protein
MLADISIASARPRPTVPLVFESSKLRALLTIVGSLLVPIIGTRILLGGIAALYGRVIVDARGIAKLPTWFWGGFRARWDEIESWDDGLVDLNDRGKGRCVRLRLRGRKHPVRISDSCAHRPGFERFVEVLHVTLGQATGV